MTAAYTHPDWNKPVGSDTGPNVPLKARDNLRVLRDSIFTGKVKDWLFERQNGTGTADDPQYFVFKNTVNSIWFRQTNTWTSGKLTSCLVEWSDDGGSSWASVLGANAIAYDASLNITSESIGSGFLVFVWEAMAKARKALTDLATHVAATGTAVHGHGTMSTQNKTAVDIDGGTIDGAAFGASARGAVDATRVTEDHAAYSPGSGAGVAIDWSKGSSLVTNNGTNTLTFSNVPASGRAGHVVDVTNLNNTNFPAAVDWGLGGKPSVAGAVSVSLMTRDGGTTVRAILVWRAV